VSQNAITTFLLRRSLELARARLAAQALARGLVVQALPLRVEPRVLYNPSLNSSSTSCPASRRACCWW